MSFVINIVNIQMLPPSTGSNLVIKISGVHLVFFSAMIFDNVNNVVVENVGSSIVDNTNNSIHINLTIDTLVLVDPAHHRHLHNHSNCPPVLPMQPDPAVSVSDDEDIERYSDCSLCREGVDWADFGLKDDHDSDGGIRSKLPTFMKALGTHLNGDNDGDSVNRSKLPKFMKALGNTGKRRLKTLKAFTKALKK